MDRQLIEQLIAINREFYTKFASAFSETRSSAQMRLDRIVAYIGDAGKALDIGCGNGRLAERLGREGKLIAYVGVDASAELITIASSLKPSLKNIAAEFYVGDITQPNWTLPFANAEFDIAIALAVLHHVPSFDLRCAVLRDICALLKPNSRLILSNWQFDRNERQRKRIIDWKEAGFDEKNLEPGDALLAWKRGGVGYRFCHLVTKEEMVRLAEASGFIVVKQYYADADLNLYSVLKKY
ncbi:MAG: class I SAM-dependent methyltransferase [Chloroflexi bacterium]|nr:class I SAM-dependent methyltransferase [Chloroflexota bacterium]